MANFNEKQRYEIKNSDEFIDYLASKDENANEDDVLREFLAKQENVAKWAEKFAKESTEAANTYMEGEKAKERMLTMNIR